MPFSNGTYTGLANSFNDAQAETVIDPLDWNALFTDIETAFNDLAAGSVTFSSVEMTSTTNGSHALQLSTVHNGDPALVFLDSSTGSTYTGGAYWYMLPEKTTFSGVVDYTFGMHWNINPTSPSNRIDTSQPAWGWTWEPYYKDGAGGQGLLEHNWAYISIDGSANFRPYQFNINLTTHVPTFSHSGIVLANHYLNTSVFSFKTTPASSGIGGATIVNGTMDINASGGNAGDTIFTVAGQTGSDADFVTFSPDAAVNLQNIIDVVIPTTTASDYVSAFTTQGTVNTGNLRTYVKNHSSSGGVHQLLEADSSTGDSSTRYHTGTGDWSIGTDSSASGKFKISKGDTLGTTDAMSIDTSGNIIFTSPNASSGSLNLSLKTANDGADNNNSLVAFVANGSNQGGIGRTSNNSGTFGIMDGGQAIILDFSGVGAGGTYTNVMRLGLVDAASPAAQTFKVQSVSSGNGNNAGANWTLKGSLSNGSGASGDIIIQTGDTGAASGTQNAAVTGLTIKGGAASGKSGSVLIGSAALSTSATDGFLYVPTCAGTPTGAPTAVTGLAPIVINTTNNKLYFYSGGSWRDAGP